MDKAATDITRMEKPERTPKNFSIIVNYSDYMNLRKISVIGDTSLGGICRQLLSIIPASLYTRLQNTAYQKKIPLAVLARQLLEKGLDKEK